MDGGRGGILSGIKIKYNSSMQLLLKCYWYLSCLQLSCACLVIRRLDYILNEVNEKVK